MAKKENSTKLTVFEIVWYAICAAVILWGLTYIVLGLVSKYADINLDKNVLLKASEELVARFHLGFLEGGMVILSIGVVAAVIVLLINANKVGKSSEKAARRAARLARVGEETPVEPSAE